MAAISHFLLMDSTQNLNRSSEIPGDNETYILRRHKMVPQLFVGILRKIAEINNNLLQYYYT